MDHARTPASDPGLARFGSSVRQWASEAALRAAKLRDDADGSSSRRRAPMWQALALAKRTGGSVEWDRAMELLATAALDSPRPAMAASIALSGILAEGFDIPFGSLAKLVAPIELERSLGAPGYDWASASPIFAGLDPWPLAVEAASLSDPARGASPQP